MEVSRKEKNAYQTPPSGIKFYGFCSGKDNRACSGVNINLLRNIAYMKIRKYFLLTILLAGFLLQSCDKLKEPYATLKESGDDTTTVNVRKVLLEDYTGHLCVNCPSATETAHILEQAYGGKLILIAVHAGNLAVPSDPPFTADYTSSAGEEWYNTFGIYANPLGMVNRKPFGGHLIIGADLWASAVDSLIHKAPDALITIENSFNATSSTLTTIISTKFKSLLQGSFTLNVCITEDSLISAQKNSDTLVGPIPVIHNYVFMDVLRGTINGNWGKVLTSSVDTSLVYKKTYVFSFSPSWIAKNCSVVSFVYNSDTKEIIQTEKTGVLQTKK